MTEQARNQTSPLPTKQQKLKHANNGHHAVSSQESQPATRHATVVLNLSDYGSLAEPANAKKVVDFLKTLQEQGKGMVAVAVADTASQLAAMSVAEQTGQRIDNIMTGNGNGTGSSNSNHNKADADSTTQADEQPVSNPVNPVNPLSQPAADNDAELSSQVAQVAQVTQAQLAQVEQLVPAAQPTLVIPEIDELEQKLAARPVGEGADEAAREVIREWVRGLPETGLQKPIGEKGRVLKRRRTKDKLADQVLAKEWVLRLNLLFEPLAGGTVHISLASKIYTTENQTISNWKQNNVLKAVGQEKNKVLLNEKALALAVALKRRFGGHGSKTVSVGMNIYNSLNK